MGENREFRENGENIVYEAHPPLSGIVQSSCQITMCLYIYICDFILLPTLALSEVKTIILQVYNS